MTRYAVFLRGINVGGVRVPMPALRALLESLGCSNVKTWLATGNVALDDVRQPAALKAACEQALSSTFHYEAYVVVRPAAALAEVVAAWPFDSHKDWHRYVVFGGKAGYEAVTRALAETPTPDEKVALVGEDLMWHCPKGASTTSAVAKALNSKQLKPLVTTRNLNTIEKML